MKTNTDWCHLLDELKLIEGVKSDSKLGDLLNVSRSYISAIRTGKKGISRELGEAIFKRLGREITLEDYQYFLPHRLRQMGEISFPFIKSSATRKSLMLRSNGKCELCAADAPFILPNGNPYLEEHLIIPEYFQGLYSFDNVVLLCPNCHAKVRLCPEIDDLELLVEVTGKVLDEKLKVKIKDKCRKSNEK